VGEASVTKTVPEGERPRTMRGRLFRKYAATFVAVVCLALVSSGLVDIWFSYQEQRALLVRIQQGQAEAAAASIGQFLTEIEHQMEWATLLPWSRESMEQWRFDAVRLLREVPAITELTQLDADGRELSRMSRQAEDVIASEIDHSREPAFIDAMAKKLHFGPVYFLEGSEPYMTLALAGARRENGVIIAQVNLKFIWDVVSRIKVGRHGVAYVVDAQSRLIAHPDISLVLGNINMSHLPQVQAASVAAPAGLPLTPVDLQNRPVLSAHAVVAPLHWLVFVDLPIDEAYAPLYLSFKRSAIVLIAAIVLAFAIAIMLARRMIVPIRALHDGATRIGGGDLTQHIHIKTGDELQELGEAFNKMASQLGESYATLERKVELRTRQLELANEAKSRFLAAASHDLRQPLHALGLFVGQLHGRMRADERRRIISRVEAALAAMNELFNALLDISKLDAGATITNVADFPVARLLTRAETTFAEAAREKGLSFRVVQSRAWVRSDFILLERVVFNLISNAVRYTQRGGLVVGCRKRETHLCVEVWDTGTGIPADQHDRIFGEFYRRGESDGDHSGGLGLGLAIVDRLCRLLGHRIHVRSILGKGSVFAVDVPMAQAREQASEASIITPSAPNVPNGKLVVVIDDDPLVREGMGGIFRSWGCTVIAAETDKKALTGLSQADDLPDLIISDYYLSEGRTGLEAVEKLRGALSAQIPAFLITGDTNPEPLRAANARGFHLLQKPVDPMVLRAMFNQATKRAP
jgi:signal transduction histidine kinase/ActR/RegA family two-component response regulator